MLVELTMVLGNEKAIHDPFTFLSIKWEGYSVVGSWQVFTVNLAIEKFATLQRANTCMQVASRRWWLSILIMID